MKAARILVLSLATTLVFASAVYVTVAVADGKLVAGQHDAGQPDPLLEFVGNYFKDGTGKGNGWRLELAANGGCQRYECWNESGRQLFGPTEQGAWTIAGAHEIEIRWNEGKVEHGSLSPGAEVGRTLWVEGTRYWEPVEICDY